MYRYRTYPEDTKGQPALLRVSRQIHTEALPLYYATNRFRVLACRCPDVHLLNTFEDWMKCTPVEFINAIPCLTIELLEMDFRRAPLAPVIVRRIILNAMSRGLDTSKWFVSTTNCGKVPFSSTALVQDLSKDIAAELSGKARSSVEKSVLVHRYPFNPTKSDVQLADQRFKALVVESRRAPRLRSRPQSTNG